MSRKKLRRITICVFMLWTLSAIGIFAQSVEWSVEAPTTNIVGTGNLRGEIVKEKINPSFDKRSDTAILAEEVTPGDDIEHFIYARNTGNQDMFIRLKVHKFWADKNNPGKEQTMLDPDMIEIQYTDFKNSDYWHESIEEDEDGNEVVWYYYKSLLPEDEITKEPLMSSYKLSDEAGRHYREQIAVIDVDLECLQATEEAIEEVWGITADELEVELPEVPTADEKPSSYITFISPEKKFEYDLIEDDILLSFQSITPGEYNSQNVIVSSAYDGEVTIGMYANYKELERYEGDAELVNKLLNEYSHLTITGNLGTAFYDGPVWQNYTEVDDMEDPQDNFISLGVFEAGDEKGAKIELTISSEIGNEYQELHGYLQWVFVAKGVEYIPETDPPETETNPPQTDDPPEETKQTDPPKGQEETEDIGNGKKGIKTTRSPVTDAERQAKKAPKTGDVVHTSLYAAFYGSSIILLLLLLYTIKKRKDNINK